VLLNTLLSGVANSSRGITESEACQGGEETTDVRAGLSNFNKQESTQTVVANDD